MGMQPPLSNVSNPYTLMTPFLNNNAQPPGHTLHQNTNQVPTGMTGALMNYNWIPPPGFHGTPSGYGMSVGNNLPYGGNAGVHVNTGLPHGGHGVGIMLFSRVL